MGNIQCDECGRWFYLDHARCPECGTENPDEAPDVNVNPEDSGDEDEDEEYE